MKSVKIRHKLTPRYILRITLEGLSHLFSYLVKYLPWIALVILFFYMSQYELFRNAYCNELENTPVRALSEDEVEYMDGKCEFHGHFFLANLDEVQKYADTSFRFSVILTIVLVSIIPYVITYFYRKENFPPKTIPNTILVFLWWFAVIWLLSSIIIYDPVYDLLKDILVQPERIDSAAIFIGFAGLPV